MELIEAWTSIFLSEFDRPCREKFGRQIGAKYSIAFGQTTHTWSEERKAEGSRLSVPLSSLSSSPQFGTHKRHQRNSDEGADESTAATHSTPNRSLHESMQKNKVKGRQIMNSKQDFAKAKEKRKRQMKYASELKASQQDVVKLQINSITRIVVQSFRKLIDCERCALFLMDHLTNELYFRPVGGEHVTDPKEIRFPASAGVAGWVASKRAPLNIRNAYHDPRFNSKIDQQTNFRTRSILCAPVLSSTGKLFGVIQMVNKKKGDSKTIQSLAKKKKTNDEHHGYESCYEPFSIQDEVIIDRCCKEVSKALQPSLAPKDGIDNIEDKDAESRYAEATPLAGGRRRSSIGIDIIDRKGSISSTASRRRSSVGNLFQFVTSETKQPKSGTPGIFGQEISVSEAMTKFQFRCEKAGPQISSRGELKNDPDHKLAASKRKRMVDYNRQRKTIMGTFCALGE